MRVQGTAASTAFDRPNVVIERIQIQSAHKFPNAAGPVLWSDQLIDIDRDCEYERRGTANAFCGVQPKAGRHFTRVTPDRSSPEFADYLLQIAEHYPGADTIHLVMDNLSSHTRKAVVERFGEKAGGWLWHRFTVHDTPKHGSWLNQAEIEISLFSRQCLGQRRIPSLGDLRREARAWSRRMNRDRVTINWRFTRKQARFKFGYIRNNITRSWY